MSPLLLQLLVLSCLGATQPQPDSQQRKKRPFQRPFYLDRNLLGSQSFHQLVGKNPVGAKETQEEPSFFVAFPQTAAESQKEGEKKMSRFILPNAELYAHQDLRTRAAPREASPVENFSPSHYSSKREVEPLYRKDAKKFWDHFMLRKNSASEEVVLPIKTNEMHQETCRTLPFSQVRTGVLFPACYNQQPKIHGSFHIPGPDDHLYTSCSKCLPTKFSMKRLDLNCTSSVPVVKEVMIVEECNCETQKIKDPLLASRQSDFLGNIPEHN
ncbi:hypothetical protein ASZ78_001130 [Callipepla squamata]|uniref:DAN domain-containing protein n=1 Tax=Callipepla squamata TaxID=9009 RepID=A0A226MMR2_CALSU|nr:hypothetical protein ASZ78_001130 [Callipepla squamata]